MAPSGTYLFDPQLTEIITEAFERVGIFGGELTTNHMISAQRSLNFVLSSFASRQLNLWTVQNQTLALVTGQSSYALPAGTVDLLEVFRVESSGITLRMSRVSREDYWSFPDKTTTGTPTVFYVDRQIDPVLYVWQPPTAAFTSLNYNRIRQMQDAGAPGDTLDVPYRFQDALVAGLAERLAVKYNPSRVIDLSEMARRAFDAAAAEDRERVPMGIAPDMTGY